MKKIIKAAAVATIGVTSVGLISGCFNLKNNNVQNNEQNKKEEGETEISPKKLITYNQYEEYLSYIPEFNKCLKAYDFKYIFNDDSSNPSIKYNYTGSANLIDPLNSKLQTEYSIEKEGKVTSKGNMAYDFKYFYITNNENSYKILESNFKPNAHEDIYQVTNFLSNFIKEFDNLDLIGADLTNNNENQNKKDLIIYKLNSKDLITFEISIPNNDNFSWSVTFKNNILYKITWLISNGQKGELTLERNENPSINIDESMTEKTN